MSSRHQGRITAPVHRTCALCGQARTIYPTSEEHRKAHLGRQLAFVCQECAEQVRLQVEAASGTSANPKASA